jgi:hypothetical protein
MHVSCIYMGDQLPQQTYLNGWLVCMSIYNWTVPIIDVCRGSNPSQSKSWDGQESLPVVADHDPIPFIGLPHAHTL